VCSNFERYQRIAWAYDLSISRLNTGVTAKSGLFFFGDFRDEYSKLVSALVGISRFTRPGLRLLAST